MHSIILFFASFISVMLMGLQSQWVRDKHAIVAFICSIFIGLSNLAFFKLVPDATITECAFWIAGGAFGIVSSIYAHNIWLKFVSPKKHRKITIDANTF